MSKPRPITIEVGGIYLHRGRPVLVAESDPAGIWLAPVDEHDAAKPYHLPYHKLGQLKPREEGGS